MATTLGKQFEEKVKEDWKKISKDAIIDRNYDITSGYAHISGISDFTAYLYPNIYYLEVKTIKGNTFPISNLTQLNKLKEKIGIKGVRAGVIIWFYEHESKIVYVPAQTFVKLKEDNKKSFNIKMLEDTLYKAILIPSIKKRVFYDSDYSVLLNLSEGD